jgi:hypothetical protein
MTRELNIHQRPRDPKKSQGLCLICSVVSLAFSILMPENPLLTAIEQLLQLSTLGNWPVETARMSRVAESEINFCMPI